jgi:hypothetical protein
MLKDKTCSDFLNGVLGELGEATGRGLWDHSSIDFPIMIPSGLAEYNCVEQILESYTLTSMQPDG